MPHGLAALVVGLYISRAVLDVDLDMSGLLFSVIDFVLLSAGGSGWECS